MLYIRYVVMYLICCFVIYIIAVSTPN